MDAKLMKEVRQIRNLLILIALKSEATTEEVGKVTGMGYSNVSALVPLRPRKKGKTTAGSKR
jgi:hypothetical protein